MIPGSFIAIPLPEELKPAFIASQNSIIHLPGLGRLQDPNTAHITLRYFGNVATSDIASIRQKMEGFLLDTVPFDVEFGSWAAAPPRAAYIKIIENERLGYLANFCRSLNYGQFDRRPFVPHITVIRVANQETFDPKELEKFPPQLTGSFKVKTVSFFIATPGRSHVSQFNVDLLGSEAEL